MRVCHCLRSRGCWATRLPGHPKPKAVAKTSARVAAHRSPECVPRHFLSTCLDKRDAAWTRARGRSARLATDRAGALHARLATTQIPTTLRGRGRRAASSGIVWAPALGPRSRICCSVRRARLCHGFARGGRGRRALQYRGRGEPARGRPARLAAIWSRAAARMRASASAV